MESVGLSTVGKKDSAGASFPQSRLLFPENSGSVIPLLQHEEAGGGCAGTHPLNDLSMLACAQFLTLLRFLDEVLGLFELGTTLNALDG